MNAIGLVPVSVIILSVFTDRKYIVYLFVPTCLLMASAAISIAGKGITPAHLMLGALAISCGRLPEGTSSLKHVLTRTVPGIALLILAAYGALLAFFYPRAFSGSTNVNIFGVEDPYAFLHPPLLQPSIANLTQTIYICGSFLTFCLILAICDSSARYVQLYKACVATVAVNIGFALIDLFTYFTGTGYLLDFVHNGDYVMRTGETAVLGLKRISGSFTETSAFSATTLGLFAFTMQLWLRGPKKWLMFLMTIVQIFLLMLSTSSTGLGGLAIVLPTIWLIGISRLWKGTISSTEACFVILFPLFAISLILGAMLFEPLHNVTSTVVQSLFLDKSQSDSGVERLMLNAQAVINFFDSHGFGIGFGSVRASSFALALIASVGLPGAVLFSVFLSPIFFSITAPVMTWQNGAFQDACRMACFALLTAACISATSMDLSLLFFVFAAGAYWPETLLWRGSAGRRSLSLRVSPVRC